VTESTGEDGIGAVFSALADPTRRRLLDFIATLGEASATRLAERLPVSRQAVVKHLVALEAAGLVEARKSGREVRYRVLPERLTASAQWLAARAEAWDARLALLKRAAEEAG
jgi:DNA-binding transcriptional ArsR family regulator